MRRHQLIKMVEAMLGTPLPSNAKSIYVPGTSTPRSAGNFSEAVLPDTAVAVTGIRRWSVFTVCVTVLIRIRENLVTGAPVVTAIVLPAAAVAGAVKIFGRVRALPSAFSR